VRRAQHLEHAVEPFLADNVANAHELRVVRGHPNGEIALRHLENQVEPILALDDSSFQGFDQGGPMVGVDDGFADLENHMSRTPFVTSRLARQQPPSGALWRRFPRSGA